MFEEVDETGNQFDRQIVYTKVAEVLKDVHGRRHARPTQAGDDEQLRSHNSRAGEWESGRMGERMTITSLPLSHSPTLPVGFNQTIIPILAFVEHADAVGLSIAKDKKLIGAGFDLDDCFIGR